MPSISSGGNATFTVPSGYVIDVQCPGGWVQLECPVGTKVFEGNPANQTFGPYTGATQAKITSVLGTVYYEVDPRPTGNVDDPGNVAITGGTIQGAMMAGPNVSINGASRLAFRKAFAKVLSGSRARLLIFGDSTTVGAGAGTNTGGTTGLVGARAKSWPVKLAAALTSMGIPAYAESIMGDQKVTAGGESYVAYDPRLALTGSFAPSEDALGGLSWLANTLGSKFSFTPSMAFDRFDVYTLTNSGNGSITVDVDGGATITTINTAGGLNTQKTTVSCTAGTHTINLTTTSASSVYVQGIVPYSSTAGGLDIISAARWGGQMVNLADNTTPYRPANSAMLNNIAPDLAIIQLTINDANGGVSASAFAGYLATIDAALASAGATTILMSGIPSNTAATTDGSLAAIVSAVRSRAAAQGLVYADLGGRCESYAAMNAAGWMFDAAHGNAKLYADEGFWMARTISAMMQ